MRQTTDDYHIDPFKPIQSSDIPYPDLDSVQQRDHEAWQTNTMTSLAYKFCVQAAKVNLTKRDFDKTELKTFENCLNKYDMAFSLYAKEKTTFHNSLD